jgi:hypothetical protein
LKFGWKYWGNDGGIFLYFPGYIPGGIIFGMIIDTTCLKWRESTCGRKQSCLVYDPHRLSWTIMAFAIVCKLISSQFCN